MQLLGPYVQPFQEDVASDWSKWAVQMVPEASRFAASWPWSMQCDGLNEEQLTQLPRLLLFSERSGLRSADEDAKEEEADGATRSPKELQSATIVLTVGSSSPSFLPSGGCR
jgi:hypothetical protein